MFERLKRLIRNITSSDDDPESFDHPRPQRANPNPPDRDWFARVRDRSHEARVGRATADAKALAAQDSKEPHLSREASQHVDDVLAKAGAAPRAQR
jgi:hypothetical protein